MSRLETGELLTIDSYMWRTERRLEIALQVSLWLISRSWCSNHRVVESIVSIDFQCAAEVWSHLSRWLMVWLHRLCRLIDSLNLRVEREYSYWGVLDPIYRLWLIAWLVRGWQAIWPLLIDLESRPVRKATSFHLTQAELSLCYYYTTNHFLLGPVHPWRLKARIEIEIRSLI